MKSTFFFLLLAVVVSSCSRKSERQLYEEGDIAYSQQNYENAIKLFAEAVDRAPTSAYAESSQYRIALTYSNDLRDPKKSLEAFKTFLTLFPKSPIAPTALFLTGFLYNNDLHQMDSAKAAYEMFLRLYPNDSLARSATFELASLGKDPMQVLQSEAPDDVGKTSKVSKKPMSK